jgi:ribonucleoside-diphosphate reductase beta chain
MTDLLLTPNDHRFVIFPIEHPDLWEKFIQHKKLIWFVDEIDLTKDRVDWTRLTDSERFFVKHVLAFFAASDGIVMENLAAQFMTEVQLSEARSFYTMQMFIENEHSLMYSRLIDTYVESPSEKDQLFQAIEHMPSIRAKADWALKWINGTDSFSTRLVAFACVEGIFFSGSFCCIYWLKERGVMPGLCMSNDFIARDEGLHTDFAVLLYTRYISETLDSDIIHTLVGEAVKIEKQFILESLPCSLLGMNSTSMSQYIEFIANRLLGQLGYAPLYPHAKQPFGFMDRICLQSVTNFFDSREVNYQKQVSSTSRVEEEEEDAFALTDNF